MERLKSGKVERWKGRKVKRWMWCSKGVFSSWKVEDGGKVERWKGEKVKRWKGGEVER